MDEPEETEDELPNPHPVVGGLYRMRAHEEHDRIYQGYFLVVDVEVVGVPGGASGYYRIQTLKGDKLTKWSQPLPGSNWNKFTKRVK